MTLQTVFFPIILFVTIMPILAFSQHQSKYPLAFGDVFVLKVKIEKDVKHAKCPCLKEECLLKQVSIIETVYCPPNHTFDSIQLTKLKYILFRGKDRNTETNNTLLITAKPSGSKYYLSFSKILSAEASNQQFYHPY